TVLTSPTGGMLPGTAALINLHGYTPEQMYAGAEAVVLNFPSRARSGPWDNRDREQRQEAYDEAMDRLNEMFDRAQLYARIDSSYAADPDRARRPEYAPAAEALVSVVRGDRLLLINADRAQTIEDALDWAEARGLLDNLVLGGA